MLDILWIPVEELRDLKWGERVSGEGHIVCGYCRNCRAGRRHLCPNTIGVGVNRAGAFAEYLCIPAENVYPVAHHIKDDIAAIFDPLGNAIHAALSFDLVGEDVLVTGAGPIGIMSALIAQKVGARHVVITDVNEYKLKLAQKMGLKNTLKADTDSFDALMKKLEIIEGFDVCLEMSGSEAALRQILQYIDSGGKIAMLGIPAPGTVVDWNHVIFKGLFIKGIYGREIFDTWYKMTSMIQSGLDISDIITHQFSVNNFEEGI